MDKKDRAISLNAVLQILDKYEDEELSSVLKRAYNNLPSVISQRPTGHWIWDKKSNVHRCSCCNQFPWRINTEENDEVFIDMKRTNAYKFCPNCGIRIQRNNEN